MIARIFQFVFSIAAVAVIAAIYTLLNINLNNFKAEIAQATEQATGRVLEVDGDLDLSWSLIPTFKANKVSFANTAWGSSAEMISFDNLEIELAFMPLLRQQVKIQKVLLQGPIVVVETNDEGRGNWVFSDKEAQQTETNMAAVDVVIEKLLIEDAMITYNDGVSGQSYGIQINELEVGMDSLDSSVSLLFDVIYDKKPLRVEGEVGSVNQLLANQTYPLDLTVQSGPAKADIVGELATPLEGKGITMLVDFNVDTLSSLSTVAGAELPDIGPIAFKGQVSDGDQQYNVKAMALQAGKTDLQGDVSLSLAGERPLINADLTSDLIHVAELVDTMQQDNESPADGEAEPEPVSNNERVFSKETIKLPELKMLDAYLTLQAGKIITPELELQETELELELVNGHLILKPLNTLVEGSKLTSMLDFDTREDIAKLNTRIELTGFKLEDIPQLKESLRGGNSDLFIKAEGQGQSIHDLMASMNGNVIAKVAETDVEGSALNVLSFDFLTELITKLNPLAKPSKGSHIVCSVVNFTIKDGVANSDKGIAVMTDKLNIIGSGNINLQTEEIDITIKPEPRKGIGISLSQLAGLVSVGGTLAKPAINVNKVEALGAGVAAGAAVATGGLSVIAKGLLNRTFSDRNPCETALSAHKQ